MATQKAWAQGPGLPISWRGSDTALSLPTEPGCVWTGLMVISGSGLWALPISHFPLPSPWGNNAASDQGNDIVHLPFSFLLGPPGTTLRPWRDAKLDTATPPVLPSRPGIPDQMLRGHPGLPKPPTSVQPASPQCPEEKEGQVAPAEAPIILSSPRTSKTDSYELVWRPRHEGGSRAPILYYVVKHRKVRCLALCRLLLSESGQGFLAAGHLPPSS